VTNVLLMVLQWGSTAISEHKRECHLLPCRPAAMLLYKQGPGAAKHSLLEDNRVKLKGAKRKAKVNACSLVY
jgi:hypothetical protein